jgi:hypothetical protein
MGIFPVGLSPARLIAFSNDLVQGDLGWWADETLVCSVLPATNTPLSNKFQKKMKIKN